MTNCFFFLQQRRLPKFLTLGFVIPKFNDSFQLQCLGSVKYKAIYKCIRNDIKEISMACFKKLFSTCLKKLRECIKT
jgi:hypothetical protein